jgi:hypothetical protein
MVDSTGVYSAFSFYERKQYTQQLRIEDGWPYDPITRATRAPGAVYLNKGQTVWVELESDGYYDYFSARRPVFCGYIFSYE